MTYAVEARIPGVVWECWKARIPTREEAQVYIDRKKALEEEFREPIRAEWRIVEVAS
jgi:hypothetical protein